MDRPPSIAVTGASGYVARNLRRYLAGRDARVVSISRRNFAAFRDEHKIITKDYGERKVWDRIHGFDALVHLVGIGRQSAAASYGAINSCLTGHVTEMCAKARVGRIIYLSGLGVSPKNPLSYFISKYDAERQIAGSGLPFTIFRPSFIVGRGDPLSKHLQRQIRSGEVRIPGSGSYSIQPIHVADAAKVITESVSSPRFRNKTVDLVGPDTMTFERYVRLFSAGTGARIAKIGLEGAYHDAITSPHPAFGVDDLNILVGSFEGDHARLAKLSSVGFASVPRMLKSGGLF